MRVSLRSSYAIMAAIDLAIHRNGTAPIQARAIARRQAIPARFLEQVLNAMKKAGLVTSLRGAQGGYLLNKHASEVSLADILEALDGSLSPTEPPTLSRHPRRSSKQELLLSPVWDRVKEAERSVLAAVSVADLADRQQEMEQQRTLMYHI
ncbi:MAG: RrF2 family transcriptional regulator [Nitrospiraceae bacterium]